MNPNGAVLAEEPFDLDESVSHHRQPYRVLQGIVVVLEGLLSVKGRVEVRELDLSEVVPLELGYASKAGERI